MKTLTVDLDLLAKQANYIGAILNDAQCNTDTEDYDDDHNEAMEVLDMLCDIEMYIRQDGNLLLKEKK